MYANIPDRDMNINATAHHSKAVFLASEGEEASGPMEIDHEGKQNFSYKTVRVLQDSLFGTIELCWVDGGHVVIKKSDLTRYEKAVHRENPTKEDIRAECDLMRRIPAHPNIIKLLGEHESKHEHLTVFEYCSGGDLCDFTMSQATGHVEYNQARKFFQQIVSAVAHLHRNDICHLDLSLENFLLDSKGNVKIADFGMARLLNREEGNSSVLFSGETGSRPGKKFYMDPLIYYGKDYSGESADVYSLGVVLFVLLTGVYPYKRPDLCEPRFKLLWESGPSTLLKAIGKKHLVPQNARKLLNKLLTFPEERLTMDELLAHPFVADAML